MSVASPATAVTFAAIPATVVTLAEIPATVEMSEVIVPRVANPVELTVVSGSPSESKAKTLEALLAFAGSVISMSAASYTGALIALAASSETCWLNIVWLSSSVFNDEASKSPAVTKSVVLSSALAPTIVIVLLLVKNFQKNTTFSHLYY